MRSKNKKVGFHSRRIEYYHCNKKHYFRSILQIIEDKICKLYNFKLREKISHQVVKTKSMVHTNHTGTIVDTQHVQLKSADTVANLINILRPLQEHSTA